MILGVGGALGEGADAAAAGLAPEVSLVMDCRTTRRIAVRRASPASVWILLPPLSKRSNL